MYSLNVVMFEEMSYVSIGYLLLIYIFMYFLILYVINYLI